MKKILLLLLTTVALLPSISAQNDTTATPRQAFLNFFLVQHIGLDKWGNTEIIDNGLPAASITELRGVLGILVKPVFNIFMDVGLGIMPAPGMKLFTLDRMPMPNSGTQYYLREMLSESGPDKTSAHFKLTGGWFGDFQVTPKLKIMPYLGVGGLTMARRSYTMILKEEGSNMQYNTTYAWGKDYDKIDPSKTDMLGYLTGRLNFQYPVARKLQLLFGLEYTYFFDAVNFYGHYSNTFNGNIEKEISIQGNSMNMIGISLSLAGI